jgi:hypothetical protein
MQSLTPERPARPTVVTAAAGLMFLVAVLGLVSAVVAVAVMAGFRDALLDALADQDPQMAEAASTIFTFSMVLGIVFSLLPAAGFTVLGLFVLRGANAARVTTWVVTGLFLACGACLLAVQGLGSFMPSGDPGSEAASRAIEDAIPGWYTVTEIVISVLELLAYIAIVVLLALPASNAFFAKPVPQWHPPAEFGGPVPPPGSAPMPGGPFAPPPPGPYPPMPPPPPQAPPQAMPGQQSGPETPPARDEQPPSPPDPGESPPSTR